MMCSRAGMPWLSKKHRGKSYPAAVRKLGHKRWRCADQSAAKPLFWQFAMKCGRICLHPIGWKHSQVIRGLANRKGPRRPRDAQQRGQGQNNKRSVEPRKRLNLLWQKAIVPTKNGSIASLSFVLRENRGQKSWRL